jgi:hypothetical protein
MATNSSAPLMRWRIDTQPETGKRISNSSAWRLRYLGRGFLTALAAASDMLRELYRCGGAVESILPSRAAYSREFFMSKAPIRVAVTGAAGQIGYALLFRIASGEMLGKDQPVILQMLEIPDEKAQKALKGVMMELDDCAFPLLQGMIPASDPLVAFKDAGVALLVGARPARARHGTQGFVGSQRQDIRTAGPGARQGG